MARARGELQRRDGESAQGELQQRNVERGWIWLRYGLWQTLVVTIGFRLDAAAAQAEVAVWQLL